MSERKLIGGCIVLAVCCAWAYILIAGQPRLPVETANGTFANPCCGAATLKNGFINLGNQRVSYVIESDKIGPYVLPKAYVGASSQGFVIRRDGYPLKLRMDRTTNPRSIEFFDDGPNAATYSFIKTNVR